MDLKMYLKWSILKQTLEWTCVLWLYSCDPEASTLVSFFLFFDLQTSSSLYSLLLYLQMFDSYIQVDSIIFYTFHESSSSNLIYRNKAITQFKTLRKPLDFIDDGIGIEVDLDVLITNNHVVHNFEKPHSEMALGN